MLKKCQKSLISPMKHVSVCTFKTSPCVPAPRAHVLKHVRAWCRYKRGRFERTHGDVLSGHTEFFSVSHTTHHNTRHNTTTRPQHHTETETVTDRDRQRRQRQTETEKEDRDRERKKTETGRQCGGAWLFIVDGVLCLDKQCQVRFIFDFSPLAGQRFLLSAN